MGIYWKHLKLITLCISTLSTFSVAHEVWPDERDYDENYDSTRTYPRREYDEIERSNFGMGLREAIKDYFAYEKEKNELISNWNEDSPDVNSLENDQIQQPQGGGNDRIERRHVSESKREVAHAEDRNEEAGVEVQDDTDDSNSLFGDNSARALSDSPKKSIPRAAIILENDQVAKVDYANNEEQRNVLKLDPLKLFKDPLFYKNHSKPNETKGLNKTVAALLFIAAQQNRPVPPTIVIQHHHVYTGKYDKLLFIAIIVGCSIAGLSGLVFAGYCLFRLRKEHSDFKSTVEKSPKVKHKRGSSLRSSRKWKDQFTMTSDDDKLAMDAEVYHFGHAKKELSQLQRHGPRSTVIEDASDTDDDDDNEDTVYECPGLAPMGDMKVMNPLFSDSESHHSQDSRSSNNNTISPPRISPPRPLTDRFSPPRQDIERSNVH